MQAVLDLPGVRQAVASPDGERVAFYYDDGEQYELHVLELPTGECRQLTDGEVHSDPTSHLAWTPDGAEVLYHYHRESDREDDIYAVDRDGSVRPVVVQQGNCMLTDVGDDGSLLFVRSVDDGSSVYRHDLDDGETVRLTREADVYDAKLSPDGEHVAYTASPEGSDESGVWVADADGRVEGRLALERDGVGIRDWSSEGDLLVEGGSTGEPSFGVVGLAGVGGRDGHVEVESERWSGRREFREHLLQFLDPPGEHVLVERVTDEATYVPVIYDLSGGESVVDVPDGVGTFAGEGYGATLADDGLLVDFTSSRRKRMLYRYDTDDDALEPLFEPDVGDLDPDSFVDARHVTVTAEDGATVGGLLYESEAEEGPSPAVVRVSRSPERTSVRGFDPSTQFLLSEGYSVLWVNQRGANRYLGPSQPSLEGELGGEDQADVVAATDWLRDRDRVDEDRIAIVGRRYGGYSAYRQLQQYPDRYACGVAWAGIADLEALHDDETADRAVRSGLEFGIGSQVGDSEWRRRSPVESAGDLDAPVAIVHWVGNETIPVGQSHLMRDALVDAGFEEGEDFEYEEMEEDLGDDSPTAVGFEYVADFLDSQL